MPGCPFSPRPAVLGRPDRAAGILAEEGYRTAVLADNSRLVDRAAAVRAGIGWWGKNTMVLAPGQGPWMLLGSVVTDAPLPCDRPMSRTCGTCQACLPACPTGALVAPGVLDARLCLAYWLQAPGVIPRSLRAAMEDRFYGCDDCLDACPPATFALKATTAERGRVDLVEVLTMADDALLQRFGRFYVPRHDPDILRRNALVALGNSGADVHLDLLDRYLAHPNPLLRIHAAWAIGRIGGRRAGEILCRAVEDPDPAVAVEIRSAMADL